MYFYYNIDVKNDKTSLKTIKGASNVIDKVKF